MKKTNARFSLKMCKYEILLTTFMWKIILNSLHGLHGLIQFKNFNFNLYLGKNIKNLAVMEP